MSGYAAHTLWLIIRRGRKEWPEAQPGASRRTNPDLRLPCGKPGNGNGGEENKEAFADYDRFVETNGVFSTGKRLF